MRFISEFHRNGKLTRGINNTFIALIPKVDNPQKLNDFRPISLVGSMYKILPKLLSNRLRLVIGSVIFEMEFLLLMRLSMKRVNVKKSFGYLRLILKQLMTFVDWGYLDVVMGEGILRGVFQKI